MTQIMVDVCAFLALFYVNHLTRVLAQENIKLNVHNLTECPRYHTKNISGGFVLKNGSYHHEGNVYPPGHFGYFNYTLNSNVHEIETEDHMRGCICTHSKQKCVRVCCQSQNDKNEKPEICPDQVNTTTYHAVTEKEIKIQQHNILIYHTLTCDLDKDGNPLSKVPNDYDFYSENGSIYVHDDKSFFDYDKHCLGFLGDQLFVLHCVEPNKIDPRFIIIGTGMMLSVPFFIITFIVYAILPELRNTHGMSLMSYVFSLTVSYFCLSIVNIINSQEKCLTELCFNDDICTLMGYIIYFSFMLSFFWLNTMCFDIYWTFRNLRANTSGPKNFIGYCVYAWGMASFCTILTLALDMSGISIDNKAGMYYANSCYLQKNLKSQFLYFYLILLILFPLNIIFFVATAFRIKTVKSETEAVVDKGNSSRHSKNSYEKYRFILYLRLFIIMGANWSMELISFLTTHGESEWFYFTDLINCFQGIWIFLLVVCNNKVRKLLLQKYVPSRLTTETSKTVETSTNVSQSGRVNSQNQTNELELKSLNKK